LLASTFFFLSTSSFVWAGENTKGQSCNLGENRLQAGTYQFWSECDSVTFCDNGTCQPRKCRRDEYPFGYTQGADLPPKCDKGSFCPDEESGCQPILTVDSSCQLNRDDQCEGPPNWKDLADTSGRGLNVNGSVCLNNICMWANVTIGQTCVPENTGYTAYGANGEFIDIVSRGNCALGLYCDAAEKVCKPEKNLGDSCTADKECTSWNCLESGVCGVSESVPHHFGVWVYVVVGLGIFGGMFGTLFALYFTHRKQRDQEREKRMQYWREQNAFHQNLQQMRETARASILSLPGNGNSQRSSTYTDDAQPMLHSGVPKSSGLRNNYYNDDGSSEYDDGLVMKKNDNRF